MQWTEVWPEAAPRWGTYSVRAHTDLGRLIADLLMYDVLVFPCPEDEEDFRRWESNRWDPELLALRVTQLGDHAVATPWDRTLREVWRYRYEQLTDAQRADPGAAYDLTASQMAEQSFVRLLDKQDDRMPHVALRPPEIHPAFAPADARRRAPTERLELVAAFQQPSDAVWLTGSSVSADLSNVGWVPTAAGIRVRLALTVPDDIDDDTFRRTLDLIEREDFQAARRRLWSWEASLPADPDPAELPLRLEALLTDYHRAVEQHLRRTRLQTVFLLVPAAVGIGLDLVSGGWASTVLGTAAGIAIDAVKSRFPTLSGSAVRASHHPGSAVEGMLSVVCQS